MKILCNILLSKHSLFLFKIMTKNIKTSDKLEKYFQKKSKKYEIDLKNF